MKEAEIYGWELANIYLEKWRKISHHDFKTNTYCSTCYIFSFTDRRTHSEKHPMNREKQFFCHWHPLCATEKHCQKSKFKIQQFKMLKNPRVGNIMIQYILLTWARTEAKMLYSIQYLYIDWYFGKFSVSLSSAILFLGFPVFLKSSFFTPSTMIK
jgi:hypothetical protein